MTYPWQSDSLPDRSKAPNCPFNPLTGAKLHEPVGVEALWRDPAFSRGWTHNPWSGTERSAGDVAMDPYCFGVWDHTWGPLVADCSFKLDYTGTKLGNPQSGHDVRRLGETDPTGRGAHDPGAKLDAGKTRVWLCLGGFSRALEEVACVTTKGAEKYAPNSWMEVPNGSERYMDAFGRHMLAMGRGEAFDADTGCRHKAQMIWDLLASLELDLRAAGY